MNFPKYPLFIGEKSLPLLHPSSLNAKSCSSDDQQANNKQKKKKNQINAAHISRQTNESETIFVLKNKRTFKEVDLRATGSPEGAIGREWPEEATNREKEEFIKENEEKANDVDWRGRWVTMTRDKTRERASHEGLGWRGRAWRVKEHYGCCSFFGPPKELDM